MEAYPDGIGVHADNVPGIGSSPISPTRRGVAQRQSRTTAYATCTPPSRTSTRSSAGAARQTHTLEDAGASPASAPTSACSSEVEHAPEEREVASSKLAGRANQAIAQHDRAPARHAGGRECESRLPDQRKVARVGMGRFAKPLPGTPAHVRSVYLPPDGVVAGKNRPPS